MARDCQQGATPGPKDAGHLLQDGEGVAEVLEHLAHQDPIERRVRKGEALPEARDGEESLDAVLGGEPPGVDEVAPFRVEADQRVERLAEREEARDVPPAAPDFQGGSCPADEPAAAPATAGLTAPRDLTATREGAAVVLRWSDAGNEVGYRVERRSVNARGAAGSWQRLKAAPPADATAARVRGPEPRPTYEYRVVAVDAAGRAAPSNAASVTAD